MKKKTLKILERILMYLGAVAFLVALFFGARVYGKMSQARLENTRKASMAGAKKENGGTKVKVCEVFYMPLVDVLKLPGTVEAYQDIDLASRMGGDIEWLGKEEGDRVEKGEKLLQLDVALIKARVERAKTAFQLAETKYKRMKDLYEKNVATKDAFDDAAAALETARAALKEAGVSLEYGSLFSPVDGVLDRRYIDEGEHIEAGKTIMKIVDIDRVKVVFNVPEKDILFFKTGQEVTVIASNGKERSYTGAVEFVALVAEPVARTYPMKVAVENPDHALRPGMILRASLVRRRIEKGIAVPFYTLIDNERGKGVFVVEDGRAVERPIEYGIFQGGMVEITKGLDVGDFLVVVGQRDLVSGASVVITEDLTQAAKAYIASGKDLSKLALDVRLPIGMRKQ